MNIAEATELVARHARNAERITGVKLALVELRNDDRAIARLTVNVATLAPTAVIDAPKNLAIVIFNDELARLTKEQDAIEARLGAVA